MIHYNQIKKLVFLSVIALISLNSSAQQDPNYTQYMYNLSVINPAYAGSKENLSAGLLYRRQWVQLEGAPKTANFFAHMPVGKSLGAGVSIVNDKIGPVEETNAYADLSYTIRVNESAQLAFGIKAGATFHKIDFNQINPTLPVLDPIFTVSPSSSKFNLGSGLFYFTDKYYLSVSVPNLLKSRYLDFDGRSYGSEIPHYFITGGYVFDLNPNLKFKPFGLVKSSFNGPTSFDISTNFLYLEKFEAGLTYRREDSFGAIINIRVTPSIRIGYAYDQIVSDIKIVTRSSHEFLILFDVNFPKKVSQSPRYF
jgi:type IX secretion system PorP/SprF family membrane protein